MILTENSIYSLRLIALLRLSVTWMICGMRPNVVCPNPVILINIGSVTFSVMIKGFSEFKSICGVVGFF